MKILLTGGAGYIGSHTAVALLDAGYEVVVVDDYSNCAADVVSRIEQITGKSVRSYDVDVCDRDFMAQIMNIEKPETVIHFAGYKAVAESVFEPLKYYDNNLNGMLTILAAMEQSGVKNIIFSSSATVYGETGKLPFKEDAARGECTNPYGWTKWMQEQILMDTAKVNGLSAVILRYFNPVGAHESGLIGENPNGTPNNLMPIVCDVAMGKRDSLTIYGNDYDTPDGTCRRDFIHVMDLAEGHVKAVEFAGKMGAEKSDFSINSSVEIFNLGTGEPHSVLEVVKAYEEASGVKINFEFGDRRAGDVQDSWADVSKANQLLGWRAERNLLTMCKDSWNYAKP